MPRDIAPSLKTEVCRPDTNNKKKGGTVKKKENKRIWSTDRPFWLILNKERKTNECKQKIQQRLDVGDGQITSVGGEVHTIFLKVRNRRRRK